MYLIKKLWIDTLVSMREDDYGYNTVGYVSSMDEANSIIEDGGVFRHNGMDLPKFKYVVVNSYE